MILRRKLYANLLLFIEVLLLVLVVITFSLKVTILREKFVIKQLKKTNYYETVFESIKDTAKYITKKSGYNEYIIEDTFKIEDVENDVNKFVKSIYKNQEIEFNTEHLKENITYNLEEYINLKGKIRTEEQKKEYVNKILSVYKNEIQLSNKLNNIKLDKYIKINNILNIIFIIDLIVIMIINKKIFNKKEYDTILFSSGISLVGINILVRTIKFSNIFIYNNTVSELIKRIINKSILFTIPLTLIVIILGISIYLINNKKIKK